MPSSEVVYRRGDHYRPLDEDILRSRRSSSTASSGSKAKRPSAFLTSTPKASATPALRYGPGLNEYLTKKKVEVKTTKNTERRVQRCIVLEDGRIIEHDDPHIVVDTVEDIQTHEFDNLEDQNLAKDLQASIERSYRKAGLSSEAAEAARQRRQSIAYAKKGANDMISKVEGSDAGSLVNDTFKRIVNTHDVKENIVRTHAAKDLGMISKRGLRKVLNKEGKVSDYLRPDNNSSVDESRGSHHANRRSHHQQRNHRSSKHNESNNKAVVRQYQTESHKRIVDTQDVHEISRRMKDGQIRTETVRTETHEIFDDKAAPDDSKNGSGSSETEHDRNSQKFHLTKKQEFTDYYDNRGNLVLHGPNTVSKDTKVVMSNEGLRQFDHWAEVTDDRVRQARNSMKKKLKPSEDAERTDALTKQPLDLNKEERTRKKETNKWLERHFGSDWSLAQDKSSSSGGRFKYLNTEHYDSSSQFDPHKVRRTMSFSSIPIHYTNPGEKVSRVIKQTTTTIKPGFDKHVVSSIHKSIAPKEDRRHRSLEIGQERPYHSTLTLNTNAGEMEAKRRQYASTNNLANETSHLTLRQVPITRVLDTQVAAGTPAAAATMRSSPKTRVQRLIDEKRSQSGSHRSSSSRPRLRDPHHRMSYYFGEDLHTRVQSAPPNRPSGRSVFREESQYYNNTNNNAATADSTSSSYMRKIEKRQHQEVSRNHRRSAVPLYRTELLKTSNRMSSPVMYSDQDESESVINRRNWRHELSKSYNDISKPIELSKTVSAMGAYKDKTQSVYDLPGNSKPSRLFGWHDEFNLHSYDGLRGYERSEAVRTTTLHPCDKVKRSKSFAVGTSSDKSSTGQSEDQLLDGLRGGLSMHHNKTKSYKQTKVSSPPKMASPVDHYFPSTTSGGGGLHEMPIAPPKEFAGLSPDIQSQYDEAKRQLRHQRDHVTKSSTTKHHKHRHKQHQNSHLKTTSGASKSLATTADAVYEFERKIPMQSSILEAQKFKTVIFVSGN